MMNRVSIEKLKYFQAKKFFSKNDPFPVTCRNWYDNISEDYNFFGDNFYQRINYCTLSDYHNIVKLHDTYKIVVSTHPETNKKS